MLEFRESNGCVAIFMWFVEQKNDVNEKKDKQSAVFMDAK